MAKSGSKEGVGGAYLLELEVKEIVRVTVGALGLQELAGGRYVYVGSARRGIEARLARHDRSARNLAPRRWHIDYLLGHPAVRLVRTHAFPGAEECGLSAHLAARPGVTVPIARFGASDCTAGCEAHLYQIPDDMALTTLKMHL